MELLCHRFRRFEAFLRHRGLDSPIPETVIIQPAIHPFSLLSYSTLEFAYPPLEFLSPLLFLQHAKETGPS